MLAFNWPTVLRSKNQLRSLCTNKNTLNNSYYSSSWRNLHFFHPRGDKTLTQTNEMQPPAPFSLEALPNAVWYSTDKELLSSKLDKHGRAWKTEFEELEKNVMLMFSFKIMKSLSF